MGTVYATVDAGVCGFVTRVTATSEDEQHVRLAVVSDCGNIRGLAARLPELDAYAELGTGFDGVLHSAVRASLRGCCSGCVVPAALFKAMQVAARVALPKDCAITLESLEDGG